MSVLLAYATHSGATRSLAEAMAAALEEEGREVVLADVADDPDPAPHEAVIAGSAVRGESVEKCFARWTRHHGEALAGRPLAVFTCSGSAADPAKRGRQRAMDRFLEWTPLRPVATANLPGWVLMDRIPAAERALLRAMGTPTGDFRDLAGAARWARGALPDVRL